MITFNENKLFKSTDVFMKFRLWLNRFKLPSVIFSGRFGPFVPVAYPINILTVVGKGIQFTSIENPTKEEITKYHDMYIEKVFELFEKYKEKVSEKNKLVIY